MKLPFRGSVSMPQASRPPKGCSAGRREQLRRGPGQWTGCGPSGRRVSAFPWLSLGSGVFYSLSPSLAVGIPAQQVSGGGCGDRFPQGPLPPEGLETQQYEPGWPGPFPMISITFTPHLMQHHPASCQARDSCLCVGGTPVLLRWGHQRGPLSHSPPTLGNVTRKRSHLLGSR